MFFAFKGEHTDGHKYVQKVLETRDCYAVIDDTDYHTDDRTILVEDVLKCLQDLANYHRRAYTGPVLALTGSNGKTTTKELMVAALAVEMKVHSTKGNYNNHIGVPLTILEANMNDDIWIIEMGANKLGDIKELCLIAEPEFGLITNIGSAHIEGFGSQENILIGKTELYDFIEEHEGMLFVNKHDEVLLNRVPENIELKLYPDESLKIRSKGLFIEIEDLNDGKNYLSSLFGKYNTVNIQAAYGIASYFGVQRVNALKAIAAYKAEMNRSQVIQLDSLCLIMDAYNANPSSMLVSIQNFAELEHEKKILFLGDMKELGDDEIQMHADILEELEKHSWKRVVLVGPLFQQADKSNSYECYLSTAELIGAYENDLHQFEGSTCLFKASRSIGLEKFAERLQNI